MTDLFLGPVVYGSALPDVRAAAFVGGQTSRSRGRRAAYRGREGSRVQVRLGGPRCRRLLCSDGGGVKGQVRSEGRVTDTG